MFLPDSPAYEGASLLLPLAPGIIVPFEYTGYKDEILASKTSAWIGLNLMTSPIYDVKGPDAVQFLNSICVNDFSTLGNTGIRHAIICNEKGQLMTDGVVLKIAEDTFRTYWLNPPIDYYVGTSGLDIQGSDISGQEYFIQIAGEKSLEILETACQADLHDIRFAAHRMTTIDDKHMRVLRLGMSGNLAYEVHGPMADFDEVYRRIVEAGREFGAKQLGFHAYAMNHTEGGFPNIHMHYPLPWFEEPGLAEYLKANPLLGVYNFNRRLCGSVGDDIESRYVTPYDLGWGFLVKFNHEFIGRKALAEIAEKPPRTVVTLEWNADDVGEVYASQFKGNSIEPCERIDAEPMDMYFQENVIGLRRGLGFVYRAEKVMADGNQVGISSGRLNSYYYNRMISLAFIKPEYAVEGKELTVIWGTPGTPQKEIRVRVVRYPYTNLIRNENRDVETIPRYQKQSGG